MLRTLIAALLAAGLAAVPASADQGKGKGKSKGKDKDKGHHAVVVKDKDEGRREALVFSERDREQVRTYWVQTYGRGKCPPGLESFEADLLEEPAPIADGQSPFAVVVAAVERIAVAPEAADDAVVAAHDASRKPAHGRRLTRWPDEVRPIAV